MAKIPTKLQNDKLSEYLRAAGLELVAQGKVRNTWRLGDGRLLVVATDRISAFDFVFPVPIPKKGEVLTALTHFWLKRVLANFDHHLVDSESSPEFNAAYDLRRRLSELPIERCLVVEDLKEKLYPFEMIFRHHIGGSVFKKYQETGLAGGHELPRDLPKWAKLEVPIFTPSTKEDVGHDINVDADYFFAEMDKKGLGAEAQEAVANLIAAYSQAYEYAETKKILILDTKFEIAGLKLADEILTPDSSRFSLKEDWEKAMQAGRDPYFYDKEVFRDYVSKIVTPFEFIGVNKLNPENSNHTNFVHGLEFPPEIITKTTNRYLQIFELLTSQSLTEYQKQEMGV